MDRETLERLAREAGFDVVGGSILTEVTAGRLSRFGMVVALECAKACDDEAAHWRQTNADHLSPHAGAMGDGAAECATAIRERFKSP